MILILLSNYSQLHMWVDLIKLLVSTHVCDRHYLRCITTFQLPEFLVQNSLGAPTQVFEECGLEYPPQTPNQNLVRTGHMGFELVWSAPPPKNKIWSGLGTLDLSWSGVPPPPAKDICGSWCVETNRCIPQGYRIVLSVPFINLCCRNSGYRYTFY